MTGRYLQLNKVLFRGPKKEALTPAVNPVDINLGDFNYAA